MGDLPVCVLSDDDHTRNFIMTFRSYILISLPFDALWQHMLRQIFMHACNVCQMANP